MTRLGEFFRDSLSACAHQLDIYPGVKPFAEPNRELEHPIIGNQNDYVARGVENCRTDLAMIKVLLDNASRLFGKSGIQIV
jgi:hypothetical protein